jgi:hypothetical protein
MAGNESLYRRNPEGNFIKVIQGRRGLLNQTQYSSGKTILARNPAYVVITGKDNSCGGGGTMSLPIVQNTWDAVYQPSLKMSPDIESVQLEYGGDWGLARKVTAVIKCYKLSDFERIQKHFLLPGNDITIKFGRNNSWGIDNSGDLHGFKVATFAFSATAEGVWSCSFTAVSASTAIKNLDMQAIVCNGCNPVAGTGPSGNNGPLKFITGKNEQKNAVKGVAQLIASDAQKNGETSINQIPDGHVVTEGDLLDYNPETNDNKKAALVIYTGDHLRKNNGVVDWVGSFFTTPKSEVEFTNNQVFVSLGYVVHRIIDDQLLRSLTCQIAQERNEFNKLKVIFDPIYSKCKVAQGITSGDPVNVLLLGDADYMNNNGNGKNFDTDCKNLGAVKALNGTDVELHNILIHRDVVVDSFNRATFKRNSESDNTDVKDTKQEVVNIIDFFSNISDAISSSTGGAISLRLVEHPKLSNILVVVDQNYGMFSKLDCIVFDPIDADGSTRTCAVQSNVGSQEYKASMFVGSSKNGDAISALRNCEPKLTGVKTLEHLLGLTDKKVIIKDPGNLGENNFNGQDINALKSAMCRIHKNNPKAKDNETIHYPGLSISLEIDGAWGIVPGNAVSSTQIPKKWRNSFNSYFMVTKVTHNFQDSDWVTNIDGILSYYPNINYITL